MQENACTVLIDCFLQALLSRKLFASNTVSLIGFFLCGIFLGNFACHYQQDEV